MGPFSKNSILGPVSALALDGLVYVFLYTGLDGSLQDEQNYSFID